MSCSLLASDACGSSYGECSNFQISSVRGIWTFKGLIFHGSEPHLSEPHLSEPHLSEPHLSEPHLSEHENRPNEHTQSEDEEWGRGSTHSINVDLAMAGGVLLFGILVIICACYCKCCRDESSQPVTKVPNTHLPSSFRNPNVWEGIQPPYNQFNFERINEHRFPKVIVLRGK
jgi:hypothetical protein